MISLVFYCLVLLLSAVLPVAEADTFPAGQHVVGHLKVVVTRPGDTLAQVARRYDMGYVEMEEANPSIVNPRRLAPGTVLIVPSQFVLPRAPHQGIVINLAEMRLYYYKGHKIITHPIGIGRQGEETPLGKLKIVGHTKNPTWYVPKSIRKKRAQQGVFLPKSVPPGPNNPLGSRSMRLSPPPEGGSYLIHGTNDPLGGIGRRSSSGCLRLYPEDIKTLYTQVPKGTTVHIVNQPYKVGWRKHILYLESHIPLDAHAYTQQDTFRIQQLTRHAAKKQAGAIIYWDLVDKIAQEMQGIPQIVGRAPAPIFS